MFDIGWTEMAVIALIALIVIGPKDLPKVLRSIGQWTRKARMLTREFQSGLDEMIREADLDDARKTIQSAKGMNPQKLIQDTVDPTGEVQKSFTGPPDTDDDEPVSEAGVEETDATPKIIKTPTQIAPGNSVKPPSAKPTSAQPDPVPVAPESQAAQEGDAEVHTVVEPADVTEKKTA